MTDCSQTRQLIRAGTHTGSTAGLCPGYLQANVVILPADFAEPFAEFCFLNPKPCPLLAMGGRGEPMLSEAGSSIDIRTDVAGYYVYRDGEFETEETSISDYWSDDMVAFALGCSHSFENALASAGIGMRHIQYKSTVPMFQTNVETIPNEVFGGKLVVSMRPIPTEQIDLAVQISSRFPHSHGAPVHIGNPGELGIDDISVPNWGDPVRIEADETPVFWACGVTSHVAVRTAKPPIAITHRPGSMLITELAEDSDLVVPGLG